jgi:hypothetical protein
MTKIELIDSLDGLFAYDSGCTDSGICDNLLKEEVKEELKLLTIREISEIIRELYLSDEALKQGYTIEDCKNFIEWLSREMDYDI